MTKQERIEIDWRIYKQILKEESEEKKKSIKKRPVYRNGGKCAKSKQERWALYQLPGKKEVEG